MQEEGKLFTEISERILKLIDLVESNPNDFAKRLGYGRSQAIYDIINGKAKPSFDFFQKLLNSEYSDIVNVNWLITGKGEIESRTKPSQEIADVDLKSRPNSRPISKSENLGLQKWGDDNLPVEIVDVRAAANVRGLSIIDGHVESLGVLPVPRHLITRTKASNNKFLWFPIIGDSMEPTIYKDDYILGSQVVDYEKVRDNYIYIVSTKENGIVIKRVLNRLEVRGQLYARSDNRLYSAFNIDQDDIVSIWEARARLSFKFPNEQIDLFNKYMDLDARIEQIEEVLKRK